MHRHLGFWVDNNLRYFRLPKALSSHIPSIASKIKVHFPKLVMILAQYRRLTWPKSPNASEEQFCFWISYNPSNKVESCLLS